VAQKITIATSMYGSFSKYGWFLVGGIPNPSEKSWSSSVGMMTFPTESTEWKNKIHVPNHQPLL
jgi:hypothetical protein